MPERNPAINERADEPQKCFEKGVIAQQILFADAGRPYEVGANTVRRNGPKQAAQFIKVAQPLPRHNDRDRHRLAGGLRARLR